MQPCEEPLQRLQIILIEFSSLGGPYIKTIDRFRFPRKEILEIRGVLLAHVQNLNGFLLTAQHDALGHANTAANGIQVAVKDVSGAVGNVQDDIEEGLEVQQQTLQAVELIGTRHCLGSTSESVLPYDSNDDPAVWKDLRRNLLKEGFTRKHISKHRSAIKQYLAE